MQFVASVIIFNCWAYVSHLFHGLTTYFASHFCVTIVNRIGIKDNVQHSNQPREKTAEFLHALWLGNGVYWQLANQNMIEIWFEFIVLVMLVSLIAN